MRPLVSYILVGSLLFFLLLPTLTSILPAQAASPSKITVGPNIDISNSPNSEFETTIAINPNNPSQIVAGSNDNGTGNLLANGLRNVTAYYSSDGGATWKSTPLPIPPLPNNIPLGLNLTFGQLFDPGVAWDTQGNVYFSAAVYFDSPNNPFVGVYSGIAVSKSSDGGRTWSATSFNFIASSLGFGGGCGVGSGRCSFGGGPVQDKTAIAIDTNPTSPFRDTIYVAWDKFPVLSSAHFDTLLSRSTDHGATFSSPVSPTGLPVGSSLSTPTSPNPFVGPDGTLYVAWDDPAKGQVAVSSSTDGGQTFGPASTVGSSPAPAGWAPGTYPFGSAGLEYPSCGADTSAGSHRGTLYCSWNAETPTSGSDVFASHSTDQGKTWSSRLRVNDDPVGVVKDQGNQWLAVDPTNGRVSMSWKDPRNDPADVSVDVFYATSTDGGLTFSPNVQVTTAPTPAGFLSDYEGIAAYGGVVHPVWTDERAGVDASGLGSEIFTATITFGGAAKLDQVPSPLTPNVILLATLLASATIAFSKRRQD